MCYILQRAAFFALYICLFCPSVRLSVAINYLWNGINILTGDDPVPEKILA